MGSSHVPAVTLTEGPGAALRSPGVGAGTGWAADKPSLVPLGAGSAVAQRSSFFTFLGDAARRLRNPRVAEHPVPVGPRRWRALPL